VVAVSTSTVLALLLSLDPGASRASHAVIFALGSNAFFWAYQVGPGSNALHVIDTHLNPRFLSEMKWQPVRWRATSATPQRRYSPPRY
jgi:hypothetical protein